MGASWGQRVHGRPSRRALGAPLACALLSFGGLLPGVATASGWSVRRVVEPAGSVSTALAGVSCVSRSVCFGVGQYDGKRSLRTLVERWDGARWTIPKSAPRLAGQLFGVSCSSPSACTAVGASMARPLVVRWNGKRWFRQGTPSTGSDVSSLAAVSCPGRNLCVAVGHFMSGYYTPSTLVERWNGKRWQIDPSPNAGPADGSISGTGDFRGVSCPSARVCVAVGTSGAGAYPPVFARWNGHHWSKMAQPAGPLPFGSITVSCSAVNACTAIGTVWEANFRHRDVPGDRTLGRNPLVVAAHSALSAQLHPGRLLWPVLSGGADVRGRWGLGHRRIRALSCRLVERGELADCLPRHTAEIQRQYAGWRRLCIGAELCRGWRPLLLEPGHDLRVLGPARG